MRTVFFGTPELAVPFLDAILADPAFDVVGVVTQTDELVGRKQILTAPPVKALALERGIEVYQPKTLKSEEAVAKLRAYDADVFVVVAYGKIIPPPVLALPKHGCVNVHPSLLPRHRGPTPMNAAIADGDAETGITVMQLDPGMDTGPILAQETIVLDSRETLPTLSATVMRLGPPLLVRTLKAIAAGRAKPRVQNNALATITTLLDRDSGRIDWNKSCQTVDRLIRAYEPWPGTWTVLSRHGKPMRVKIIEAQPTHRPATGTPGMISVSGTDLFVSCADQDLQILILQPEGKSAMRAADFIRGYSDVSGATLA